MGMTIMGYFNPHETPTQRTTQIGFYTRDQVASLEPYFAKDNGTEVVGRIVALNYLAAAGRLSQATDFYSATDLHQIREHGAFGKE